jgi:hypothetical protein
LAGSAARRASRSQTTHNCVLLRIYNSLELVAPPLAQITEARDAIVLKDSILLEVRQSDFPVEEIFESDSALAVCSRREVSWVQM